MKASWQLLGVQCSWWENQTLCGISRQPISTLHKHMQHQHRAPAAWEVEPPLRLRLRLQHKLHSHHVLSSMCFLSWHRAKKKKKKKKKWVGGYSKQEVRQCRIFFFLTALDQSQCAYALVYPKLIDTLLLFGSRYAGTLPYPSSQKIPVLLWAEVSS
jgi:hypothetical protein